MKTKSRLITTRLITIGTLVGLLFLLSGFLKDNRKVLPLLENPYGRTIIEKVGKNKILDASFVIISKSGRKIAVDPSSMPTKDELALDPDIITVSHLHFDHYDPAFISSHPGALNLISENGRISLDGINVYSVPASHAGFFFIGNRNRIEDHPTNFIYVFEVDGLRIAHMGDTGQTMLHDWQVAALGKIDIMFMKLNNPFITIRCSGPFKNALKVIEQVQPRILIPTHTTELCAREFGDYVGGFEKVENVYTVDKDDSLSKRKVVLVDNSLSY